MVKCVKKKVTTKNSYLIISWYGVCLCLFVFSSFSSSPSSSICFFVVVESQCLRNFVYKKGGYQPAAATTTNEKKSTMPKIERERKKCKDWEEKNDLAQWYERRPVQCTHANYDNSPFKGDAKRRRRRRNSSIVNIEEAKEKKLTRILNSTWKFLFINSYARESKATLPQQIKIDL